MEKLYTIIMLCIICLYGTGCSEKDEMIDESTNQSIEVSFDVVNTKVGIDIDENELLDTYYWESGDRITLYEVSGTTFTGKSSVYILSSTTNNMKTGLFKYESGDKLKAKTSYVVVYVGKAASLTPPSNGSTNFKYKLNAGTQSSRYSQIKESMIFTGGCSVNNFKTAVSLNHVVSQVEIAVKGFVNEASNRISRVEMKAKSGQPYAADIALGIDGTIDEANTTWSDTAPVVTVTDTKEVMGQAGGAKARIMVRQKTGANIESIIKVTDSKNIVRDFRLPYRSQLIPGYIYQTTQVAVPSKDTYNGGDMKDIGYDGTSSAVLDYVLNPWENDGTTQRYYRTAINFNGSNFYIYGDLKVSKWWTSGNTTNKGTIYVMPGGTLDLSEIITLDQNMTIVNYGTVLFGKELQVNQNATFISITPVVQNNLTVASRGLFECYDLVKTNTFTLDNYGKGVFHSDITINTKLTLTNGSSLTVEGNCNAGSFDMTTNSTCDIARGLVVDGDISLSNSSILKVKETTVASNLDVKNSTSMTVAGQLLISKNIGIESGKLEVLLCCKADNMTINNVNEASQSRFHECLQVATTLKVSGSYVWVDSYLKATEFECKSGGIISLGSTSSSEAPLIIVPGLNIPGATITNLCSNKGVIYSNALTVSYNTNPFKNAWRLYYTTLSGYSIAWPSNVDTKSNNVTIPARGCNPGWPLP